MMIFSTIIMIALATILFAGFILVLWFNRLLDNNFLFFIVAGMYFILFLIRNDERTRNKLNDVVQNIIHPENRISSGEAQVIEIGRVEK